MYKNKFVKLNNKNKLRIILLYKLLLFYIYYFALIKIYYYIKFLFKINLNNIFSFI